MPQNIYTNQNFKRYKAAFVANCMKNLATKVNIQEIRQVAFSAYIAPLVPGVDPLTKAEVYHCYTKFTPVVHRVSCNGYTSLGLDAFFGKIFNDLIKEAILQEKRPHMRLEFNCSCELWTYNVETKAEHAIKFSFESDITKEIGSQDVSFRVGKKTFHDIPLTQVYARAIENDADLSKAKMMMDAVHEGRITLPENMTRPN